MAKTTTKTKTRDAEGTPGETGKGKARTPTEFLVLDIGGTSAVGSKANILHVADSVESAKEYVSKLSGASPSRVAIVGRQVLLKREPQVAIVELEEKILI